MRKYNIFIYLLTILLLVESSYATTIHGTIYDWSLNKITTAVVEINTQPNQQAVAKNGSYSFNVPNGKYLLTGRLLNKNTTIAYAQENVTVSSDGSYIVDLILFPDVEEGLENFDIDLSEEIIDDKENSQVLLLIFMVLFVSGIVVGFMYYFKTRKADIKEEKVEYDDLEDLIKIIKQEGGRTTQKEIRKQIPLSEAKISLMIAELEHKGVIEKIKKGRGNIIILKKK